MPRRSGSYDAAPTAPAAVLLASAGQPFRQTTLEDAAARAGGHPVAVLTIARMHGYAWGIPNPGLLPTAKERAAQVAIVQAAVDYLTARGIPVDGQVTVTRNPASVIAGAAKRRSVGCVVLETHAAGRLRRILEGSLERAVVRRLHGAAAVHAPPSPVDGAHDEASR